MAVAVKNIDKTIAVVLLNEMEMDIQVEIRYDKLDIWVTSNSICITGTRVPQFRSQSKHNPLIPYSSKIRENIEIHFGEKQPGKDAQY